MEITLYNNDKIGEGVIFNIKKLTLHLPQIKLWKKTNNVFTDESETVTFLKFQTSFEYRVDNDMKYMEIMVLGFGISYYHQWDY